MAKETVDKIIASESAAEKAEADAREKAADMIEKAKADAAKLVDEKLAEAEKIAAELISRAKADADEIISEAESAKNEPEFSSEKKNEAIRQCLAKLV